MQVSDLNNVKIYNLSVGKSLPEWLSERKRRAILKKNVDIRKRIELIQDFDMPGVSTSVRISKDGEFVLATGIYKPRVKCFDVNNLSLKFERCYDAEAVTFEILSDDYSKLVFLQCDRYLEFHSAQGRYHRLRIPKFGRDMKYHLPSCDLFVVGTSSDIYRLNLERGQFLSPFTSKGSTINKCAINPVHHLLICGTQEGHVEAWDPRSKTLVASLDCAFNCIAENKSLEGFPSVTALKFDGSLGMGVGTASGQILLYDIRSNKPFYIKDHMYGLPIKDVEFHYQQELVFSMDSSILKIWNKNDGRLFTSVEATSNYNNLCTVPNTGLFFLANESPKIQTYYVPALGPAPKWASFLDSLTEELEEGNRENVYDDYKFVTKAELENLGLEHLIGTNILRAYMHGYFMDIRLYKKAKSVANPFEFEDYRKKRIRDTIEKTRENRVALTKLPKVNKDLALRLMDRDRIERNKAKIGAGNLLEDDRFRALFNNPDFEIDKTTEEFRLINPILARIEMSKQKQLKKKISKAQEFQQVEDELEGKNSSEESSDSEEESSDDELTSTNETKKQDVATVQQGKRPREESNRKQPKMFELRQGEVYKGVQMLSNKQNKSTLGDRVTNEDASVRLLGSVGNRELTFTLNKYKRHKEVEERNKRHREERKRLVRLVPGSRSSNTQFWRSKSKRTF